MIKTLIVLISVSFLSGCGAPEIADQEQCSPRFAYVDIMGERYIDTKESVCFCRMYRWSRGYVGGVGATTDKPIEYCHKLVGHPPDAYFEVARWYEKMRRFLDRAAKKVEDN